MKRFGVFGLAACAAVLAMIGQAHAAIIIIPVTCTNNSSTDPAAVTSALGGATYPNLVSGTVFEITGMCAGDYNFKVSGVTFANRNNNSTLVVDQDGFNGLVEISGAHVTINAITLEGPNLLGPNTTSTATITSNFSEETNLALHDGAVALLENAQVGPGATDGIIVLRSSSISILNTVVSGNGTGSVTTFGNLTSGIWASDGSSIRLGAPSENASNAGGTADFVKGNGSAVGSTSCQGFDILLTQSSSGDLFGTTVGGTSGTVTGAGGPNPVGANCGAIHLEADSSLKGRDVTVGHVGQFEPAVTAIGSSAMWFDENLSAASPGGSTIIDVADATTNCNGGGCSSGAILAGGASSVVLQDTGVAAPVPGNSGQQPAIDISASSTLILAGGNEICGGALSGTGGAFSGSTCGTPTTSPAQVLQADHSSSIFQQQGQRFGYANHVDSVTGSAAVQVQSSMDLGQGLVSGNPSISWTIPSGGTFNILQNSSFRLSGGVSITGSNGVKLQQGSNAFFNVNNGGTNAAVIVCANTANNPMAHVSNPTEVTPNVTTYNLNDVLSGVTGATHPGQVNACLNF
jgi:hypothetical protein